MGPTVDIHVGKYGDYTIVDGGKYIIQHLVFQHHTEQYFPDLFAKSVMNEQMTSEFYYHYNNNGYFIVECKVGEVQVGKTFLYEIDNKYITISDRDNEVIKIDRKLGIKNLDLLVAIVKSMRLEFNANLVRDALIHLDPDICVSPYYSKYHPNIYSVYIRNVGYFYRYENGDIKIVGNAEANNDGDDYICTIEDHETSIRYHQSKIDQIKKMGESSEKSFIKN